MAEEFKKEKALRAIHGFTCLSASAMKALYERYGEEALDIISEVNFNYGLANVTGLAKRLGVRMGDGTPEDWIKMARVLCDMSLMDIETESTADRAVCRIKSCPVAEAYKTIFPEACRKTVIGIERGIVAAINPNLEVHADCLIPEGAATCDIVCEWKPGAKP